MTILNIAVKSWIVTETEQSFIIRATTGETPQSIGHGRILFAYPKPLPAIIQGFVNSLKEMEKETL